MKKLFILFTLIIIYKAASEYESCSSFEEIKESYCESLYNDTHYCYFSNDQCKSSPIQCQNYPSENENFVDETCKSIILSKPNKKCKVSTTGNKKICEEIDKECEDYKEGDDCNLLDAGSADKRCVLYNKKCEAHSNQCTGLDINKCSKNIPQDNKYQCVWKNDHCEAEERLCKDFIIYSDKNGGSSNCNLLKHTSPKSCILAGDVCYEDYLLCEDGNGNEDICNIIKPLKADNTIDPLYKCEYQGTTCSKVRKKCSDFKKGEDNEELCEKFTTSNSLYTKCVLENHNCQEKYLSCDSYHQVVESSQRKEEDCANIIPVNYNEKKCKFDDGTKLCNEVPKECNEIRDKENCDFHDLNTEKTCFFKNNICQEVYRTCELYNNKIQSKNEDDCKSIPIFEDDSDNKIYECIFIKESSTCSKNEMKCEDYKGEDENICEAISQNYNSGLKCVFKDNKCIEKYLGCEYYTGKDKNICESITPSAPYQKCILKKDKDCITKTQICSDYLGNIEEECTDHFISSDYINKCAFINNKCIDFPYKYCSDYRGTNKEICESIRPYYYQGNTIDLNSRCIYYEDKGCIRENFECESYTGKDKNICESIIPSNPYKKCVFSIDNDCTTKSKICSDYLGNNEKECTDKFISSDYINKCSFINNKCIDFPYKYCSDYRGTNKEICESIRPYYYEGIYDENQIDPTSRCIYYEGKGCKRESNKCSSAKSEYDCFNLKLSDSNKMCFFINNQCIEQYSSCLNYQNNEPNIDKVGCESLVFPLEKCIYEPPATNGQKGTCTTKQKNCSEFKKELFNIACYGIILTDKSKYCSFSNNVCSENKKYCSDITEGATDEICNSAKVSYPTNECVRNGDKCEENIVPYSKPKAEEKETEQKENNSGSKIYLGNLLFVMLLILF